MAKVLELINSGATELTSDFVQLQTGMTSIIQTFQINIIQEPTRNDNNSMASPNMTDVRNKQEKMSQNMDDVTDSINITEQKISKTNVKLKVSSQNMTKKQDKIQMTSQNMTKEQDKIQMTSQKFDEIGIFETFDVTKMTAQKMIEIPRMPDNEINEINTELFR